MSSSFSQLRMLLPPEVMNGMTVFPFKPAAARVVPVAEKYATRESKV